jgi:addiction module HigA family antidote
MAIGALPLNLKMVMQYWWIIRIITERTKMTRMFNPPHPGETLREDILPALGLNVTQAATQLNVTRATLSRVLNGRAAISPEMALRLEGWLGLENGGNADVWIAQQAAYDLWQARKAGAPKVQRASLALDTVAA